MLREIMPNGLYHVYNRATEKRTIFYNERDYAKFLDRMFYYKARFGVKILSYVLLPNHFHFLLEESTNQRPTFLTSDVGYKTNVNQYLGSNISKFMSILMNSYTKYFNLKNDHSGRIFQGAYKSKLITDDKYLYSIIAYINLNPLKHKIVENINNWPYTSHHDIMSKISGVLVDNNDFINKYDYKEIIQNNIDRIKEMDLEFD